MYAQIKDGRIVAVTDSSQGDDVAVTLPEDFDWQNISRYELADDGRLIAHPAPEPPEDPLRALERRLAELEAGAAKLEASGAKLEAIFTEWKASGAAWESPDGGLTKGDAI